LRGFERYRLLTPAMQSRHLNIAMYAGDQFRDGAIEKGISDLVANHDIIAETNRQYIVGYICKAVNRRKQGSSLN